MSLIAKGQRLLDRVRGRVPQAQAEVFLMESESRLNEWSEGNPENTALNQNQGFCVRVVDQGRLGFAFSNKIETESEAALMERAAESSRFTSIDPYLDVPSAVKLDSTDDLQLVDTTLKADSWNERWSFLERLESDVRSRDKRLTKVLRASYREGYSQAAVLNTRGVSATSDGTSVSFSLACVAVENGETQIGYGFQGARHYADLKPEEVVNRAVEHTLSLLGGRQVPSGRYDLVLDPLVAAEMLELFAHALRADQVQKGKSFLANRMGQVVGSSCLTLTDDGRLLRGLGSSPFDAEGLPTQKNVLLKQGVLKGYMYDSYTARKSGGRSTGNAGRGSYRTAPEPEATNFFFEPGQKSAQDLLSQVRSGLYVRMVMGLHTVDTISGDYSLGITGQRIENGRITHAVRGVTIAGNLLDLLKNVEAVGSDLTFMGSIGSPTLWIRDVSVGGN